MGEPTTNNIDRTVTALLPFVDGPDAQPGRRDGDGPRRRSPRLAAGGSSVASD
jgi:hypothetical protein